MVQDRQKQAGFRRQQRARRRDRRRQLSCCGRDACSVLKVQRVATRLEFLFCGVDLVTATAAQPVHSTA